MCLSGEGGGKESLQVTVFGYVFMSTACVCVNVQLDQGGTKDIFCMSVYLYVFGGTCRRIRTARVFLKNCQFEKISFKVFDKVSLPK